MSNITERLDALRWLGKLRRMLAAREGKPDYKTNVAAIKAEIARLEKLLEKLSG